MDRAAHTGERPCTTCGAMFSPRPSALKRQNYKCAPCRTRYNLEWLARKNPALKPPRPPVPLADRFWAKVDRSGGGCWEWKAAFQSSGYGRITIAGRMRSAHRVAYELSFGPVPTGKLVCHHCDNRRCVRPDHLYAGTAEDNMRDMVVRGRRRGGGRSLRKLTPEQVAAIRAATGTKRAIAAEFGISPNHVRKIRTRETWRNLP